MSYVIAVAAAIGAGKTSLVRAIADRLVHATTIHYDCYERATEKPAHDMVQWLRNGADFDDLLVPNLAEDLQKLRNGRAVVEPMTNREIPPEKYIIFEMPLGREHKGTAGYIDLLIWVETPLDIALARKLKEFTGPVTRTCSPEMHRDCLGWLDRYLDNYLGFLREVLLIQKGRVSVNADIVLDGQGDLDTLAQAAAEEIMRRMP
ncbi:MAG: hypothetical protein AB1512_02610 [Thermodesulfobacteriota bacterium]